MLKRYISALCVVTFASVFAVASAADLAELENRVEALEAKTGGSLGGVELYGSFRPSLRFSYDEGCDGKTECDNTDFKDNLSRLGVKGRVELDNGWSAFYRGEWKVRIGDDKDDGTDLGDARLAYVGIGTPLGEIAFGQQWNTYYNIVDEVTDIYLHASSPFGWDVNGPFRTPSLLTYKHNIGDLKIQAGARFNGNDGGNNRHADEYNVGIGYSFDNAYLGVAFRNTQGARATATTGKKTTSGGQDTDWWAVGGSWNPTDRLYLAFTYQDGEQDDGVTLKNRFTDADKSSLDLVASYDFGDGWTGIVGYFDSEDDSSTKGEYDGFNLTVIKSLNSSVQVWAEWLSVDADDDENKYYPDDSIQIGFRYDFSTK